MSEGKIEGVTALHVDVDPDLCCAYGTCVELAPEIFSLDEGEVSTVLVPDISEEDANLVETAIRECPTQALSIVSTSL